MYLSIAICIGAGVGLAALIGACFALNRFRRLNKTAGLAPIAESIAFLMRDGRLHNATDGARRLLAGQPFDTFGWEELRKLVAPIFPDLPAVEPEKALGRDAPDHPGARLTARPEGDSLRIEISAPACSTAEMMQMSLQSAELDMLRSAMASIPSPVWESDADGDVLWSNAAYQDLCDRAICGDPQARLFGITLPTTGEPAKARTSIADRIGGKRCWYEVSSHQTGGTWLHHAIDIDAVVRAETAQRNFVQTLTKTFAHLPIGLAIFDRNRRLALFNPALIDLTSLPVDFLSGRPNLLSFFDHMRENRLMPEPKNYSGWREQMAELVAAASDDRYSETWSLPTGLTYKITGRPHPDGAIAFLIEDISAEVSLTRRFRAEMELSQSVLDAMEEAIVVFSHSGVLTFSNAAYRALWKSDPDGGFAEVTVLEATRHWQSFCAPSPVWGDLRNYVLDGQDRAAWDAELKLANGQTLTCNVEPVPGGATVVRFSATRQAVAPKLRIACDA